MERKGPFSYIASVMILIKNLRTTSDQNKRSFCHSVNDTGIDTRHSGFSVSIRGHWVHVSAETGGSGTLCWLAIQLFSLTMDL